MAANLKIIQINIWKGKMLPALVDFLQPEAPDLITMQEVSGGAENLHPDKTIDLFAHLKKQLAYDGAYALEYHVAGYPKAYAGKAILTNGTIIAKNIVWIRPMHEIPRKKNQRDYPNLPRNLLDCTIRLKRKTLHVICAHGAWTHNPTDTPEKIRQAKLMVDYLKTLHEQPYILAGDLNVAPNTEVIRLLETVAHNAVTAPPSNITRTTHPRIHKTAGFKPQGVLCDYLFTSSHFTVVSIDAPEVAVSDHLPVRATLRFSQ